MTDAPRVIHQVLVPAERLLNLSGDSFVSQISTANADGYRQAIEFIYGRLNFERTPDAASSLQDFKLARMEELLSALGNPHLSVPTVHIAGSKGKGSTATMVARIAEAAGYQVGLFTSPHVDQFEERFTINSRTATADEVISIVDRLRPVVQQMDEKYAEQSVTFFELATAIGWLHFEKSHADLAVMEVGLGGRLDSTNVCSPLVTAITSISRDHTRLLGNTLELIAREKAGITKRNVPMVTAVTAEGPANVIAEIAHQQSAPLYRFGHEFRASSVIPVPSLRGEPACYRMNVESPLGDITDLSLGMSGEHQTRNAAIATVIAQLLRQRGFNISDDQIRSGLLNARCPLRIEVVGHDPLLIIDAAHNAASIQALCETLKNVTARRRVVIFATSRDKEADQLLASLNALFDEIWLTRYTNNPRATPIEELAALATTVVTKPWKTVADPQTALQEVKRTAHPDDLICVTGSFFLAAEAKALLVL